MATNPDKELAKKRKTPMQAIRAHCLECCGGQYKEVRLCEITRCELHRFRMGKEERDEIYEADRAVRKAEKEKEKKKKESKGK